ncbi:TRAP transporter large permease subunit [Sedimentitalea sp. JM2-8]|uniref:TRAP transporter large permease subunit n=1 Tax=Sedimentitalea xiamensis TaxID=3050037 RepID=A0ABT7FIE2_9RHOB|nr:TRAP transporter large permease subunit [Sedimentitalea xiamensis]MDK3074904.1 TRAP transporter large permease subunit [Sedimentitalea xiamensis]
MADQGKSEALDITDELIAERRAAEPGQTPADMAPWMRPIVAGIDVMNLWVGRITCLMLVPIILVMVYEVVARKVFLAPTDFSFEYSRMLAGAMFMLGAGYALMRGVHIRADFLYRNWPRQTQATVDATLYLLFYFPAMLFFFWVSLDFTIKAWSTWERSMDTAMMAPLAPARTAMPVAAFFLFLQGISEFLTTLYAMNASRRRLFLRFLPVYVLILGLVFVMAFFPDALPFVSSGLSGLGAALGLDRIANEYIGLLMIAVMLFSIFVGFPISFTLIFLGFVFGAWGFSGKLTFYLQTFQFNATMLDDQLVAVPLFVFMGIMMEQAGLMERLFTSVQLMFSRTRGSLYVAVLFVSTIFAAATGIVGASVTILGIMAARTMNKSGYDVRLASGTITAGGTLGILIPPSIMLVVMGPVLEVPVTDLFAAAIMPGIMLAVLYMAYALVRCWINPNLGPILPPEDQPETSPYYFIEFTTVMAALVILCWLGGKGLTGGLTGLFPLSGLILPLAWVGVMVGVYTWAHRVRPFGFYYSDLWREFFLGLVPPTTLVAFALGAILLGWATPAEAAATGAFGAILLALGYRKLSLPKFYDALIKTLEISVLIMFLVAASNFFGAVFSRLGTPTMLTELLLGWDLNETMVLIIIMALIFLLGWPLEWVPIVLIIVPILIPALDQLGVNLTWFGILVAVNLQTAWLSPPVALSAYFLKGVVPEWDLKDIYFGMMQFMLIQLLGLILIFSFPQIALWLPAYIYGP